MIIYVHYTEITINIEDQFPNEIRCEFFSNINELNIEKIIHSSSIPIFCINDQSLANKLKNKLKKCLIVNSHFLSVQLKLIYKDILKLSKNYVFLFLGFQNKNLLTKLQFKVLAMGGIYAVDESDKIFESVNIVIPYRFTRNVQLILNKLKSYRIYSHFNIDSIEINEFEDLHDKSNSFQMGLFNNCRIRLVGFESDKQESISLSILENNGTFLSISDKNYVEEDIFIFAQGFQSENYAIHLKEISETINLSFVNEDWYWDSVREDFLVPFENYPATICECNHNEKVKIKETLSELFYVVI